MDPLYADRLYSSMHKSPISTPIHTTASPSPSRLLSSPYPITPQPKAAHYYDRFIPSRTSSSLAKKCLFGVTKPKTQNTPKAKDNNDLLKPEALAYEAALRNELLGTNITEIPDAHGSKGDPLASPLSENLFKYCTPPNKRFDVSSPYSVSPISSATAKMLVSPRRASRKIPKAPFKVLDAPDLQDDYYLNLLDWSSLNVLSVGLGSTVYLWNASTCQVSKLCDLDDDRNTVTSVSWSEKGHHLAIGTHKGYVQIWDAANMKQTHTLSGHSGRVGSLSWCGDVLCSGSRDNMILQWDPRLPAFPTRRLLGHAQEVCGLRWSPNHQHLASGGNDNKLFIWDDSSTTPIHCLSDHKAAVKALAWSPHQHGLLASGGGTADRTIRFWNVLTGQCLQSVDTGSQVCNLSWSHSSSEFVSTHGYSQNQIIIWRYPSLVQIAKLTGHTTRVLYLAMSPDGQTIVTGAGDETLRFWNAFTKSKSLKKPNTPLEMASYIR
ncbi:PREDICTED: fizzy-related protein homolog [Amphimedon queenslandica]|uniref:Fizzy-related protein homolog n=1 Tax=Amphimedon queenslandica TaxID=400682 RepID=A0A1X7UBN3_AMPQE|nr:PREDICTED: fizzy-related protein homolog [Amphimedon queenslandica]|eukprot:XP_003388418.1 PREDICTED: fizzy-related protein homolog [Amphimedon queenslandica]